MKTILFIMFLCIPKLLFGADYYVDSRMTESGSGSQEAPFKTIGEAANIMKAGDICYIKSGEYFETIRPAHSGEELQPIVFQSYSQNDKVTVFGADPVPNSAWERTSGNIYKAKVKLSFDHENQVFCGQKMMVEARLPNVGDDLFSPNLSEMDAGTTPDKIVDAELPNWDFTGAHVWLHTPKYWSNWTTKVQRFGKGYLEIENIAPFKGSTSYHVAKEGAEFFIFGCKAALDSENEWFYDDREQTLYICSSDENRSPQNILIKKRMEAFDLRGRSHIHIKGLEIIGAKIQMDNHTSDILMDRLKIFYPYHSSQANRYFGIQRDKGMVFEGKSCTLQNSEIAHSSGCGIVLDGETNYVVNCYIHDTNYIGAIIGGIQLRGKGNVISHCTLTRSGRTVISYGDMYQSLIQFNDMSLSGLLTSDLGLTYGNTIEGGNSEVRYNWLHDNADEHLDMGLYYDHGTQNIISHHNVVWNVGFSAFLINHYAYFHLAYNNTFIGDDHGFRSTWGNKYDHDLHGCRFFNNIFSNICITNAGNYMWGYNQTDYKDLIDHKFLPKDSPCIDSGIFIPEITENYKGQAPDLGAYEFGAPVWKVGHDFNNPPKIDVTRSEPVYRNRIKNSAFEHEDHIQPWFVVDGEMLPIHGGKGQTTPDTARIRMGNCSMELGPGKAEIAQNVNGLTPNTWYEFAGWLRVDRGERACLGVRNYGGNEMYSMSIRGNSPKWNRCLLYFQTGTQNTSAQVFVHRHSTGEGHVFIDDFGLIQK